MNIVNACTTKEEINLVTAMLLQRYNPVYADIWRLGLNLSLRISDLLSLRFSQLDTTTATLTLKEAKTGKTKEIRLNKAALEVIARRRQQYPDHVYLFESNSARRKFDPITRHAVCHVFKEAGDWLGLKINTHSMRKTRGAIMYRDKVPLAMIAKVLNHSSEAQVLRYIGITREQVLQTYTDYEL